MKFPRPTRAWLLAASLGGLAVALALLTFWQRTGARAQILAREAATIHAITTWQRALEQERVGTLELAAPDREFALLALETSRLPNVIAVEAFSLDGRAASGLGSALGLTAPTAEEWTKLRRLEPLARFRSTDDRPLEVTVPVHEPESNEVTGAVRFWIDGTNVRREFGALDRRLIQQALLVWLFTGLTLALVLTLVFRRLARAEAELRARTDDLQHANRELAFAAKTSALGAITAHLVHGLRNPVAGLASLDQPLPDDDTTPLRDASAAARRIRQMVDDVVTLLREEKSDAHYEVSPCELLEPIAAGLADSARPRGVTVAVEAPDAPLLDNRAAALAGAILRNLARNALEAAPATTGRVTLRARADAAGWEFSVEDNGPGLPESALARLFEPTLSSKPDGAGIGLAISRQLALHLGADLTHERATPSGACFRLRLPFSPRQPPR